MKVAVLLKAVQAIDRFALNDAGLRAQDTPFTLDPLSRVAAGMALSLARRYGGTVTAFSMGTPGPGGDVLVSALQAGADCAYLISDPCFAGADSVATASVLAQALRHVGPFDLVVCGYASIDSSTGLVPVLLAQALGMPLVRNVTLIARADDGRCFDITRRIASGTERLGVATPCVAAVAERAAPAIGDGMDAQGCLRRRIRHLDAAVLGLTATAASLSRTRVSGVLRREHAQKQCTMVDAGHDEGLRRLARTLLATLQTAVPATAAGDAFGRHGGVGPVSASPGGGLVLVTDPTRPALTAGLLQKIRTSRDLGSLALRIHVGPDDHLDCAGTDIRRHDLSQDELLRQLAREIAARPPLAVIVPESDWGIEFAGRLGALTQGGIVTGAAGIGLQADAPTVLKATHLPGHYCRVDFINTRVRIVTLVTQPVGVPMRRARDTVAHAPVRGRAHYGGRVEVLGQCHEIDPDRIAAARLVVCVGRGVAPAAYAQIEALVARWGGAIACTRKVADDGLRDRREQVGVTGLFVAPALYIALGVSGSHHHTCAIAPETLVLAINSDPQARMFRSSDYGIVGDAVESLRDLMEHMTRLEGDAAPVPVASDG